MVSFANYYIKVDASGQSFYTLSIKKGKNMNKQLIALKLGSTITTIYKQGEGLVLKEPTMLATVGGYKNREIKAVGKEAKRMQGRTSSSVSMIYPVNSGLITDTDMATEMLREFLKKIFPRSFLKPNIKALVCVPLGITINEKKNFERVCYGAGIADVTLVPAIICSAIGAGINIGTNSGKLLVNLGGGCTNIAAIGLNSIITGLNVSVGGTLINTAIEKMLLEKYGLVVSDGVSERVKQEISSMLENNTASTEVQGINATTKETESVVVSAKDVYPILVNSFSKVADAIASVIATCPPDVASDIAHDGIYLFGGHSQISGIARFFKDKLKINTYVSDNPKADILGAAKILENPSQYAEIIKSL